MSSTSTQTPTTGLNASPSSTIDATTTSLAEREPAGTFVIAIEDTPGSLVYHAAPSFSTAMIAGNLYSTLVRTDLNHEFQPDLAESWEITEDGLQYTFHLNRAARFHDGIPVTSSDVVFTWETFIEPAGGSIFEVLESVDAPDDHTVVFSFSEPYAAMMLALSDIGGVKIMPEHLYAETGANLDGHPTNSSPIGSGPFKFVNWVEGSFVELERFDDYHLAPKPYLERLIFQTIPDANARVLALEQGEVDFLHALITPYDQISKFRANPDLQVIEGGLGTGVQEMLLFNLEHPIIGQPAVREAIAYAINREQLNELALFGEGAAASSPISSSQPYFDEATRDRYSHDPDRANQLLDDAGLEAGDDGVRFTLRLDYQTGRDSEDRMAQVIRDQLGAIGIEVQPNTSDLQSFLERTFVQGDFDMAMQLWTTGPDPTGPVGSRYAEAFIGAEFQNGMRYINEEIEEILMSESSVVSSEDRKSVWMRFQEVILNDLPVVPLVELPNVQVASARFDGVITSAVTGYLSQPRDDVHLVNP